MVGSELNAYILAGGNSRRMGTDKLFMQIDGTSLLERTIATCKACFKKVKLVARKPDRFSSLDYPVVLDSSMANGPMAGVIAALEDCDNDTCFVTAADLPDLSVEIIRSLVTQYRDQQYLGLIEANGIQPLCGIYHKSSLEVLFRYAQTDEFSMNKALAELNFSSLAIPDGLWRNINVPEDLMIGDSGA